MVSIGTDAWTSSGFNSLAGFEGDFDVAVTFEDLKLAKPKEQFDCSFNLQIEFPGAAKTQANLIVAEKSDVRQVVAQIRVVDPAGNLQYRRIRTDEVDDVARLRLVRCGKRFALNRDLNSGSCRTYSRS